MQNNELENNYVTSRQVDALKEAWSNSFRQIFNMKRRQDLTERENLAVTMAEFGGMVDTKDKYYKRAMKKMEGDGYTAKNRIQALSLFRMVYVTHQNHTRPKWYEFFKRYARYKEGQFVKQMEEDLRKKGCLEKDILLAKDDTKSIRNVIENELAAEEKERDNLVQAIQQKELEMGLRKPDEKLEVINSNDEKVEIIIKGLKYSDYKYNEVNKIKDINEFDNGTEFNYFVDKVDSTIQKQTMIITMNMAKIRDTMGKKYIGSYNVFPTASESKELDEEIENLYDKVHKAYDEDEAYEIAKEIKSKQDELKEKTQIEVDVDKTEVKEIKSFEGEEIDKFIEAHKNDHVLDEDGYSVVSNSIDDLDSKNNVENFDDFNIEKSDELVIENEDDSFAALK